MNNTHKQPFLKGLIENKAQCLGFLLLLFGFAVGIFFNPSKRILGEHNK